jgi:hypothetical protein
MGNPRRYSGAFNPVEISVRTCGVAPAKFPRGCSNWPGYPTTAFERDVRKGVPASVLAERYFASDVLP